MFHLKQFERNRSSDIRRRSTDVCFELARFSHPFVTLVIEEFQGIGGNGKGYFFWKPFNSFTGRSTLHFSSPI